MMSTTFGFADAASEATGSAPAALASINSITRAEYSSEYFDTSNSVVSDSTSICAIDTSLSDTSTSATASSSDNSDGSTNSSTYTRVDITRRPSRARIAATCCLERITNRPRATLFAAAMAFAQQRVRLRISVWDHVVGGVEQERVDLVERHELLEVTVLVAAGTSGSRSPDVITT